MSAGYDFQSSEISVLRDAMDSIGGKWKMPVLCSLSSRGQSRYNDILREVKGISNTMLSKTLKELESSGLVSRCEFLEVPVRVEYDLTDKAIALQPILNDIICWETKWQNN